MHIVYNIAIRLYTMVIFLVSPFNRKACLWYRGRKGFFRRWSGFDPGKRRVVWFHCASLGEFEQGRPVIDEVRRRDDNIFILLTFFSPSGFEVRKNSALADAVCYLPADTPANARRFIEIFRPDMAVFIKYEFWYNYIDILNRKGIPLYLISANFRADQVFFRWYGRWFGKILHMFSHIFVQGEDSAALLKSAGIKNVTVSGDTRFDRVYFIARSATRIEAAAAFSKGAFTIVAGSTWPPDHALWVRFMNETVHNIKLIIAPHEINEYEIDRLAGRLEPGVIRFSGINSADPGAAQVMVIDNMGMLSSLYSYGNLAYIGGGFGKNIHNILEACTHGLPVIFGPRYRNFREARDLVRLGGAFPVAYYDSFCSKVDELIVNRELLIKAGHIAGRYVKSGIGASKVIVNKIFIS